VPGSEPPNAFELKEGLQASMIDVPQTARQMFRLARARDTPYSRPMHATTSSHSSGRLVALDWGSSSLRAYLLGERGRIVDRRAEPWGILQLPEGDFRGAFDRITADWRTVSNALPAIASGMIGSAQGWVAAPYVDLPAGAEQLARRLASVPGTALRIVPGLAQIGASPDVMRGEETQIVGALAADPGLADALVVLPGTHSKWVRLAGGRIREFTTYMTGELFSVLRAHSILGRLAKARADEPEPDSAAFARGVAAAQRSAGGLGPLLFSARASVLVGDLPAESSLEYLSGLLIGDELRAGLAKGGRPTALIGDPVLCARYVAAFDQFGMAEVPVLADAAPMGLWAIAQHASA
jgi:2-dehydro-3-deoxygalactonokinase